MQQSFLAGLLAALCAVLVWGLQFPVAKDVFVVLDPFHTTLLRYLVAIVVIVPVFALREGVQALHYGGRGVQIASIGALGMSVSPLLVFSGVAMIGAEHGSVIVALQPSVMAITQWVLFRKRPSNFTLGCMVTAFMGVLAVVTRGQNPLAAAPRELIGSVCVLGGGFCWIYYTLGVERFPRWSTWRITVLTMIPGTLATLLITAALVSVGTLTLPSLDAVLSVGWKLTFLGFFGVVVGMLAWNFGTKRIGPLNSMLLTNLIPVVTFSYRALQGHAFLPIEIIGAAIVVLALVANNLYLRWRHIRAKLESPIAVVS